MLTLIFRVTGGSGDVPLGGVARLGSDMASFMTALSRDRVQYPSGVRNAVEVPLRRYSKEGKDLASLPVLSASSSWEDFKSTAGSLVVARESIDGYAKQQNVIPVITAIYLQQSSNNIFCCTSWMCNASEIVQCIRDHAMLS